MKVVEVKCAICGDSSHPTRDCLMKNGGTFDSSDMAVDQEYAKFLAELDGKNSNQINYQQGYYQQPIEPYLLQPQSQYIPPPNVPGGFTYQFTPDSGYLQPPPGYYPPPPPPNFFPPQTGFIPPQPGFIPPQPGFIPPQTGFIPPPVPGKPPY